MPFLKNGSGTAGQLPIVIKFAAESPYSFVI